MISGTTGNREQVSDIGMFQIPHGGEDQDFGLEGLPTLDRGPLPSHGRPVRDLGADVLSKFDRTTFEAGKKAGVLGNIDPITWSTGGAVDLGKDPLPEDPDVKEAIVKAAR